MTLTTIFTSCSKIIINSPLWIIFHEGLRQNNNKKSGKKLKETRLSRWLKKEWTQRREIDTFILERNCQTQDWWTSIQQPYWDLWRRKSTSWGTIGTNPVVTQTQCGLTGNSPTLLWLLSMMWQQSPPPTEAEAEATWSGRRRNVCITHNWRRMCQETVPSGQSLPRRSRSMRSPRSSEVTMTTMRFMRTTRRRAGKWAYSLVVALLLQTVVLLRVATLLPGLLSLVVTFCLDWLLPNW